MKKNFHKFQELKLDKAIRNVNFETFEKFEFETSWAMKKKKLINLSVAKKRKCW